MASPRLHPLARLILCALGASVAAAGIVALMAAVYSSAPTTVFDRTPQQQLADFLQSHVLLLLILPYPSVLLWLIFCRSTLDRRSMVSLGLHRRVRDFSGGWMGGALAVALLFGVLWLTAQAAYTGTSPAVFDASLWSTLGRLAAWALAFGAVGFMEELLFRGYALHNLNAWLGLRAAIIAQAIGFAMVHLANAYSATSLLSDAAAPDTAAIWADAWRAMPNLALIGVFFALCYLKTGALWFPIGFHAAWNFFLGCVFSLPVSGLNIFHLLDIEVSPDAWISGGTFGPEGSLLLTPILLALVYLASRAPNHPQALADLALLTPQSTPAPAETEIEGSYLSDVRLSLRSRESFDPAALAAMKTVVRVPPPAAPELVADAPIEVEGAPAAPVEVAPPVVAPPEETIAVEEEIIEDVPPTPEPITPVKTKPRW